MVRKLTLIALVGAALALSATASADSTMLIRGDYQMGPFSWQMGLGNAEHIFGKPTGQKCSLGVCRVRWARPGMVMVFGNSGATLIRFIGDSRVWQTGRGLHVGDPVSRIHALYPKARQFRASWGLIGRPGTSPSLAARAKHGRVAHLVVTRALELSGSIPG